MQCQVKMRWHLPKEGAMLAVQRQPIMQVQVQVQVPAVGVAGTIQRT